MSLKQLRDALQEEKDPENSCGLIERLTAALTRAGEVTGKTKRLGGRGGCDMLNQVQDCHTGGDPEAEESSHYLNKLYGFRC